MSSSISAGLTTGTAIAISGDTSGSLVLQTNGTTTAVTLDTSQNATFAGKVTSAGALTLASNGTTTAVTIDTSQNVGIGTTSPGSKLDVRSANVITDALGQVSIYANDFGINYGGSIGLGGAYNTALTTFTDYTQIAGRKENSTSNDYAGYLSFATRINAGPITERMRIDSSGNVGIGITGMADRLAVYYTRASQQGITIKPSADTGGGNAMLFMNAAGTLVGYIATTASATTYATSSDYRLKDNIVPMVGALNTVAALKPVTYKWKVDGSNGQGFIAHELQSIVPDCVTGEKDAVDEEGKPVYQGIDTSFLVATLTAAIQELNAKFEEYKAAHP